MDNTKKGISNILTAMLSQVITLMAGIIIPRLVLVNLGSEANGFLNSINSILTYLSLLEAGVGTASTQALYEPIAKGDRAGISSILSAMDHFYKRTARWYFSGVLILTFLFPLTLNSTIPTWQIMAVTFLSGMPSVISYYIQGKYNILLRAEGKSYVLTNLSTIAYLGTSIAKIVLLLCGYSIVALQIMYTSFTVFQVLYILLYMKRHYAWLDLNAKPAYEKIAQSKNALVHQVSALIFNNTDTLILTYCCGLKTVSVYAMYSMLLGIIATAISNFSGMNFILGQTFNTDRKRFEKLLDVYEVFYITLTFSLFCIANIFISPFLRLYTSGVTDINYVDPYLPILFITTYLLSNGRNPSGLVINYSVHFKQTQWRAILESIINIVVSLVCVFKFGIYGVLIGTIVALLYRANDMIIYSNKKIMQRSPWKTYRRWLVNLCLFIGISVIASKVFAHISLNTYSQIIFWAIVCCLCVIPLFFVTAFGIDRDAYCTAKSLISTRLQRKNSTRV